MGSDLFREPVPASVRLVRLLEQEVAYDGDKDALYEEMHIEPGQDSRHESLKVWVGEETKVHDAGHRQARAASRPIAPRCLSASFPRVIKVEASLHSSMWQPAVFRDWQREASRKEDAYEREQPSGATKLPRKLSRQSQASGGLTSGAVPADGRALQSTNKPAWASRRSKVSLTIVEPAHLSNLKLSVPIH